MEDCKCKITVKIFDEDYAMKGNSSSEYMEMIANYVDRKMRQIASKSPRLSATKIAVLAALNIADELSKLQEDYDNLAKIADQSK